MMPWLAPRCRYGAQAEGAGLLSDVCPSRVGWFMLGLWSFALPWLVAGALGLPKLMLQNFTDGAFYLGYASHLRLLFEQIGIYYYVTRFPAIAGDAVVMGLFGEEGLPAARMALSGVCCWALARTAGERYGLAGGWLAALAWAVNPFALRLVQTGYSDVAGASALMVGLCLVCQVRVGALKGVVAGVLFACAFWCHTHAGVALVCCAPLVVMMRWRDGWLDWVRLVLAMGCGAVFATGVAVLWYWRELGFWNLWAPTDEVLKWLAEGIIPKPEQNWPGLFRERVFWLAPLPLLALVWVGRRSGLFAGAVVGAAGYVALLAVTDWLRDGYSLSLFYYFSFGVPALALATGGLLGAFVHERRARAWPVGAGVLGLLLPVGIVKVAPEPEGWLAAGCVAAAAVCGAVTVVRRQALWMAPAAVFAMQALMGGAPDGRLALGRYWKGDDWPLFLAARELGRAIESQRVPGERVRFWFVDEPGMAERAVQSFFLHEFTKWRFSGPEKEGQVVPYPELTEEGLALASTREQGLGLLALLDRDTVRLGRAVRGLVGQIPGAEVTFSRQWGPETEGLAAVLVRLPFSPGKNVQPPDATRWQAAIRLEAARWKARGDVNMRALSDGVVEFALRGSRNSLNAWLELPELPAGARLRVVAESTLGGVLLEHARELDAPLLLAARPVVPGSGKVELWFGVGEPLPSGSWLRLRKFATKAIAATARIHDVEVLVPLEHDDFAPANR